MLKTIGAAIGITVSAIASTVGVIIAALRYRREDRHLVVRLKAWKPLDDPRDVNLTVSIYNQGRPVFIEDVSLHIGRDDSVVILDEDEFPDYPIEVATGRFMKVNVRLTQVEASMDLISMQADGVGTAYTDDDLSKMRVHVTDGEGHEHREGLRGESLRNMRAVVKARHEHPYEEVRIKSGKTEVS